MIKNLLTEESYKLVKLRNPPYSSTISLQKLLFLNCIDLTGEYKNWCSFLNENPSLQDIDGLQIMINMKCSEVSKLEYLAGYLYSPHLYYSNFEFHIFFLIRNMLFYCLFFFNKLYINWWNLNGRRTLVKNYLLFEKFKNKF